MMRTCRTSGCSPRRTGGRGGRVLHLQKSLDEREFLAGVLAEFSGRALHANPGVRGEHERPPRPIASHPGGDVVGEASQRQRPRVLWAERFDPRLRGVLASSRRNSTTHLAPSRRPRALCYGALAQCRTRDSNPRPVGQAGRRITRLEVHLTDSVDDEPREVAFRQRLPHISRHQKRPLAITRDKALAHHRLLIDPSDDTRAVRDSPQHMRANGRGRQRRPLGTTTGVSDDLGRRPLGTASTSPRSGVLMTDGDGSVPHLTWPSRRCGQQPL